ncbi:MAG: bifunctional metallophosphatase/5'-nucleotidase [Spirochaetales bacterium]|nr:bifunctional metallophosphatase/5'-nucleotidase [Spirochaetales bacterium]
MGNYKNLTILHSNDLHGDFLAEKLDMSLLGGISMLSGYINKVRNEEKNVLYAIAGDMLQGSVIDSEFMGISTIEIMNLLAPDIASIGNHEIDYGLAHLLFLERCAKFPIVNANLFIKNPYTRLFKSHKILRIDGMNIMFIGIITDEILMGMKKDMLGSFVDVEDAAREVGHICNTYRNIDIDFTILLTHVGFEKDKQLAAILDPDWGVDLIIGGHSHTILEQPEKINDILIVQAGVGTSQVGRFDIVIDTDRNAVHSYEWKLIPIKSTYCPRDELIEQTILRYKRETDKKYNRVLCRFPRALTHPNRYQESEMGNLFADILKDDFAVDVMLIGSGSIRKTTVSSMITLGELLEIFPYDDKAMQVSVTGRQLKRMLRYVFRDEMLEGGHTEFYQVSRELRIVFDRQAGDFSVLSFEQQFIEDERIYTVGLQGYHYQNFADCFGFSVEEVYQNGKPRMLTTSLLDVLVERLSAACMINAQVEGRILLS